MGERGWGESHKKPWAREKYLVHNYSASSYLSLVLLVLGQEKKKCLLSQSFHLKVTFALELFPRPALPEGACLYETTTFSHIGTSESSLSGTHSPTHCCLLVSLLCPT